MFYAEAIHSLQGALGKTSGRSYKAAPRQLLQVDAGPGSPTMFPAYFHVHTSKAAAQHEGAAREAAKLGREALGNAADVSYISTLVIHIVDGILVYRPTT